MTRPTILLTDPVSPRVMAELERVSRVVLGRAEDPDGLRRDIAEADAVIVRSYLPDDIFDAAPRLLAAVRHGAGADLVPIEAATRHGIAVANVPGVNGNAVAEFAVAQMLRLARRLPAIEAALRGESWSGARGLSVGAEEIGGRTVGIVGVGSIGSRFAEICRFGFGMRVLGHRRHPERLPAHVEASDLDRLFSESDFVVLACPMTEETRGLASAERIGRMRPGAFLVNIARGPVVDEAALAEALRRGVIAGAALDVFETEPLPRDSPLHALRNVILTPHVSGVSAQSAVKLGLGALSEALRVLAGQKPVNFVNPECWDRALERRRRLGLGVPSGPDAA